MTNPTDDTVNARKLMYLLIAEQKLRPGESMDDAALKDYLHESHRLVAQKLTRKAKAEFGLTEY